MFFLRNIQGVRVEREALVEKVNAIINKEYQSVWLINLENLECEVIFYNNNKAAPNSVSTARQINSYNNIRTWYIESYVEDHLKERLYEQTDLNYILSQLVDEDTLNVEYVRLLDGQRNYNQICYDKIVNSNGAIEYLVMALRNIDIRTKVEIDDLTGVLIRPAFFRKAEELLRRYPDKQFDLVMSDIVDFKKINETYGADIADAILKWHGSYMVTLLKDDVIIGRYGGDQMVMLGPHDYIMQCLASPYKEKFNKAERENELPDITVKYGIYLDVNHNGSIIATCDKAHMALNSIKRHYRNEVAYYNDEIRAQLEKQRRIEDGMHSSLDAGDFKVYYQPKHNARTGELVGAEALIRWMHPEYGFMSPADFIPLFEQNGFIVENDKFVLTRTCENLRRWQDRGVKIVPISINISKLTMQSENLASSIKEALDKYELSPSLLHMEITETLMDDDTGKMVERLDEIRSLGVKVELDDFGSGYSSINVLSELPLDVVKLDMSFMQQFGDRKRSLVLESCIELAKKLGFETVSEGVEERAQQELLGQLGVDIIQGYYYSKPLPESEFEIYLMQH